MEQPPKSFDDQQSSFLARVLRDLELRLNNIIEVANKDVPNGSITQPKLAANVVGNGPVFSAHYTTSTTLITGDDTKVGYNVEDFDTNNNYDPTTSVFTPTVAGYYHISASFQTASTSTSYVPSIFKNGTRYKYGDFAGVVGGNPICTVDGIVFCNGTTDFIDIRCGVGVPSSTLITNGAFLLFQGCLIRAA